MSPVSRTRRPKRSGSRSRSGDGPATLEGLYAETLRAFGSLAAKADPLDVEAFTSGLLGMWWGEMPTDLEPAEDPDVMFGLGMITYAAEQSSPKALALLRAFSAVGVTAVQRAAAAQAAARLVGAGVADPPWAADLDQVSAGECWQLRDVYDDQVELLCTFGYGASAAGPAGRHALIALIEMPGPNAWVKDLFLTDEPPGAVREMRKEAMSQPLLSIQPIAPEQARGLLERALANTDPGWLPEISEELRQFRALALARCRAMPAAATPLSSDSDSDSDSTGTGTGTGTVDESDGVEELGDDEREAIVADFLAAPQAGDLPQNGATRQCAELLVEFGAEADPTRPLRVSPSTIEAFLHEWLPASTELDTAGRDAMPATAVAWVRWAGARNELPAAAIAELVEATEECAAHFVEEYEEYEGADDRVPVELLMAGLEDLQDPAEVSEALQRRSFAVPVQATQIGDERISYLDPGDPDDRHILIEGEHPEYHEALADPASDETVDGVNPRLHLALHEMVANQLWDDDPPEAWQAAKRLLATGMSRHDVLHELLGVAVTQIHTALSRGGTDLDDYRRQLNALGRAQPEPGFRGGEHDPSLTVRAQSEPGFRGGEHDPSLTVRAQPEPAFGGGEHAPSSPGAPRPQPKRSQQKARSSKGRKKHPGKRR